MYMPIVAEIMKIVEWCLLHNALGGCSARSRYGLCQVVSLLLELKSSNEKESRKHFSFLRNELVLAGRVGRFLNGVER